METTRKRGTVVAYWLVSIGLALLMLGTNIPSPLYGVYQGEWGFSSVVLSLVFASYALALIPGLLIFGRISDTVGRRRVILSGLLVAAAGSLLFSVAQGLSWLFAARIVQGVAVGISSGAISAAIVELHPIGDRRAASLATTAALTSGGALGPLFGGVLAQYAPWPLVTPYLVHFIVLVLIIAGVWFIVPETIEVESGKRSWHPRAPRVPAAIRGRFTLGAAASFSGWAVTGLFVALVPSYATGLLEIRSLAFQGAVVFAMLGIASVTQLAAREVEHPKTILYGAAALTLGMAGVVLAVPIHSFLLMLAGTILDGVGLGLSFMGGLGLVGEIAPAENRAETLSAFYVATYLGVGIPVIGVGFVADHVGLFAAVTRFAAVISLLSIILAYSAARIRVAAS